MTFWTNKGNYTKEEAEYFAMKSNYYYSPFLQGLVAKYPWLEDPDQLKDLVEKDAAKLARDSYVDDITTGGWEKDVQRMLGDKDKETGRNNGTISELCNNVGLKLKSIVSYLKFFTKGLTFGVDEDFLCTYDLQPELVCI